MKDDDLEGLTDAEREALEGEELENEAGADANDADDEAETDGDDSADASAADGAGEPAPAEASPQSFQVPTPDLAQIDQALAELTAKREALETEYESGDSSDTYAEHRAKLRELDEAVRDLSMEKAEARAVLRMNQAYQMEWWTREVNAFKREALKEGIDYDKDDKLGAEWDRAVQFLGQDPNNAQQDARWFLAEAHEMVKARFRVGAKEAPAPRSRVDEALAARRAQKGEMPPTLAKLPEAGSQDEREGEFSHLDRLQGAAFERALAKLTPEQQDRYLTS